MAAQGWRSRRAVIDSLLAEPYRFDFHQAINLLERLAPAAAALGDGPDPTREAVRLTASLGATFPASDLAAVQRGPGRGQHTVQVNFMGLAGGFGPLPTPLTELAAARARAGDTAARDFLDIFNHRLLSLLHRARRRHRVTLHPGAPPDSPFAFYLSCLLGLGTTGLQGRMAVPDRALVHYSGLLAQQPRSLHGLERLLASHFAVPVRVVPLQGRWLALDATQVTRLGGRLGQNCQLGGGAALGSRVWDQQAGVTVELGPLDTARFADFLPAGPAWRPICALIRFYAGTTVDTTVRLRLQAADVPGTRLGGGGRLGWTSWLTTRPRTADADIELRADPG